MMKTCLFKYASYFLLAILVAGCASGGGMRSSGSGVGPSLGAVIGAKKGTLVSHEFSGLSLLIPVFDPNIPDDPAKYAASGIWPELRRTEANRFAVSIQDLLIDSKVFESVRVMPTSEATASLFVLGKIITSNGEDVAVQVSVEGIDGKSYLKKVYKHRVDEYSINDPRLSGADIYSPIFVDISEDIILLATSLKESNRADLKGIENIRFAAAFQPEYFGSYIKKSWSNKYSLVSYPDASDESFRRILDLKLKDQMFIDEIQSDYLDFNEKITIPYSKWQEAAFVESKAAREAKNRANTKMMLGILGAVAGAAIAGNSSPYSSGSYTGAAVAAVGVSAMISSVGDSKEAKMHKESLDELGKSLNVEIAPTVMKLEDREVELVGTAQEQYVAWRKFLFEYYELEKTPNIQL